jgi:HSP20 family molecular chaperone IbpA
MPGASPGSIDVNLDRRELTIRARIDEDEPEDMSVVHREYETGDFERHFQLAGDFDVEKIEAKLKDGVLRLKLPKAPEQEARRIEVKAS